MKSQLIDENKASEVLSISVKSLRTMRSRRRGPPFVKIGRLVRYSEASLQKYIESNTFDPSRDL